MAQQTSEVLSGVVENVVYVNQENGYAVIEVASEEEGDLITAVGTIAPVTVGEEIELLGSYTKHPQFGLQFKATQCAYRLPYTESAILRYLSSGILKGIGPKTAKAVVDAFGNKTFEVIDLFPEKLAKIKGISYTKACEASYEFKRIFGLREAIVYLSKLGLSTGQSIDLFRKLGGSTIAVVEKNPYVLCSAPLYFDFGAVDDIAQELNISMEGETRIKAGILHVLRHNLNNGHTCLPHDKLVLTVQRLTGIIEDEIEIQLEKLVEENNLMAFTSKDNIEFIFLPEYFSSEIYIAWRLKSLMSMPLGKIGDSDKLIDIQQLTSNITYAPLQRVAIEKAITSNAFVLTGGPGTGKTTIINAIINLFEQNGDRVSLAAPTGRAAKRLSELTNRKANTIHRLLEVDYRSGNDALRFVHNEQNLLKCDIVILDEVSMVDSQIFESLLRALKPACKIILVGDSDQLPSVGAGNILKSIIDSECVPVVCLKEIFRQAAESLIVSNAHRIVKGELPESGNKEDDYFFVEGSGAKCQEFICQLVSKRLPNTYGYSPTQDIQVLCPTKIGVLGTVALNGLLQNVLNPPSSQKPQLTIMGQVYRTGDKVMQVKNNYDIPFTRENGEDGAGAFNGDIGIIEKVDPKNMAMRVKIDDRVYFYTSEHIKQLEIAYAVTVHKSQGSEFEAVIIPVADVPPKLCYRNLFYTGVTRAKKLLVLAGDKNTMKKMVENDRKTLRYSCLAEMMRDESLG